MKHLAHVSVGVHYSYWKLSQVTLGCYSSQVQQTPTCEEIPARKSPAGAPCGLYHLHKPSLSTCTDHAVWRKKRNTGVFTPQLYLRDSECQEPHQGDKALGVRYDGELFISQWFNLTKCYIPWLQYEELLSEIENHKKARGLLISLYGSSAVQRNLT